jgi:hypothetical protein
MNRLNLSSTVTVIGHPVVDARGAPLGRVEDLVADASTGRVAYLILSSESARDDRLYPIPFSAFSFRPDRSELVLDTPGELLRGAASFRRNEAYDLGDAAVAERIYRHYRQDPFWETEAAVRADVESSRPDGERVERPRSGGAVGLLAAMILASFALGIGFYFLFPRETQVAARTIGEAAKEGAVAVVETSEDASTSARVKAALALSKSVSALDIDVDSDEGVVTLRGEVQTRAQRERAEELARDVQGVRDVVNRIETREAEAL